MTDQPPPPPGTIHRLRLRRAATRLLPSAGWWLPAAAAGWVPQPLAGYPPPQAAAGPALPTEAYTPWLTRVLAYLIDYVPYAIIDGHRLGCCSGTRETACITDTSEYDLGEFCATGASTLGQVSVGLAGIAPSPT